MLIYVAKSMLFMILILLFCVDAKAQQEWQRFSLTDTGLREKTSDELKLLIKDLDFGVRDCLCDWSINVESAADSEKLFDSNGKHMFFRSAEGTIWSSSSWQTTVFADDRAKPDNWGALFVNCEFERIVLDGKSYDRNSKKLQPDLQDSRYRLSSCLLLDPLKLPFIHPSCLSPMYNCEGGEAFFGDLTDCVATSENKGIVESVWLGKGRDKDGKRFGFHSVATKNSLPVRFEFLMVPKGFKIEDGLPPKRHCESVSFVSTKWTEIDGVSVPANCHGSVKSPNSKAGAKVLNFEAKMKYFDSQSKEFREKAAELAPVFEQISSRSKKVQE